MRPSASNISGSLARHVEQSLVLSLDDDLSAQGSPELIELTLEAAKMAVNIDLSDLSKRMALPPYYAEVWPGEHYRFLSGLVQIIQPKTVIEIGTGTGLSALAMLKFLPEGGRLVTFDTVDWRQLPTSLLNGSDFQDKRLHFASDDLADPLSIAVYHGLLSEAELFFIDASKDGTTEIKLLKNLATIPFKNPPLLVFDDIRLMNMIPIWRAIRQPKLDVTSFGHWSGTGLVRFAV